MADKDLEYWLIMLGRLKKWHKMAADYNKNDIKAAIRKCKHKIEQYKRRELSRFPIISI